MEEWQDAFGTRVPQVSSHLHYLPAVIESVCTLITTDTSLNCERLKCTNLIAAKCKTHDKEEMLDPGTLLSAKKPRCFPQDFAVTAVDVGLANLVRKTRSLWWPGTLEENVDWSTSMWNCQTRASSNKGFRFLSKWWQKKTLYWLQSTITAWKWKTREQIQSVWYFCSVNFSPDAFRLWIYIHSHLKEHEKAEDEYANMPTWR